MEAKVKVMWPQAKAAITSWKRQGTDPPLDPAGESNVLPTFDLGLVKLILDLQSQNFDKINVYCFKPSSL